jgi:hypothetical protein
LIFIFLQSISSFAQPDEDVLGMWYMYFWNHDFKNSQWGLQGDYQYRSWNFMSDQEQLLLRTGITYRPINTNIKLTAGYGFINSGQYGEDKSSSKESRIYQEALLPQKVGERFLFTHRFRFEQRFVQNQDARTRWRYNIFLNIPLNNTSLASKTAYFAFYNELFLNGQRSIGNNKSVEIYDRNRTYGGLGYVFNKGMRVQLGVMRQATDTWIKSQGQVSLHHSF